MKKIKQVFDVYPENVKIDFFNFFITEKEHEMESQLKFSPLIIGNKGYQIHILNLKEFYEYKDYSKKEMRKRKIERINYVKEI